MPRFVAQHVLDHPARKGSQCVARRTLWKAPRASLSTTMFMPIAIFSQVISLQGQVDQDAATQSMDEARHVEVFGRDVRKRGACLRSRGPRARASTWKSDYAAKIETLKSFYSKRLQ